MSDDESDDDVDASEEEEEDEEEEEEEEEETAPAESDKAVRDNQLKVAKAVNLILTSSVAMGDTLRAMQMKYNNMHLGSHWPCLLLLPPFPRYRPNQFFFQIKYGC